MRWPWLHVWVRGGCEEIVVGRATRHLAEHDVLQVGDKRGREIRAYVRVGRHRRVIVWGGSICARRAVGYGVVRGDEPVTRRPDFWRGARE